MTEPYNEEDLVIVDDTEGIPVAPDPDEDAFTDGIEEASADPMDDDW